jgi:hypothetical protein
MAGDIVGSATLGGSATYEYGSCTTLRQARHPPTYLQFCALSPAFACPLGEACIVLPCWPADRSWSRRTGAPKASTTRQERNPDAQAVVGSRSMGSEVGSEDDPDLVVVREHEREGIAGGPAIGNRGSSCRNRASVT